MAKRKNCIVCKKPFVHSKTGRPKTRFCSLECNKKFYKGGNFKGQLKWTCLACKTDFFRYSKKDQKPLFCSRKCAHRSNSLLAETVKVHIPKDATPIKKPGEDIWKCGYCGIKFFRYRQKNVYQHPRYCSRACAWNGRRLSWWKKLLKRIGIL